ncbi:MAG: radical SAM protein [bacterium]|nr:radical SAM protein [bacterium]
MFSAPLTTKIKALYARVSRGRAFGSPALPKDAVIAVTYLCNSRCTMCDFWKETRQPTVTLADYAKLPSSLRDINISGGEPTLHPQLVEIVRTLRTACPKAQMTISTNGFMTKHIVKRVSEIMAFYPAIAVRISIDGVGDMHEEIRRIPQGYDKCIATLRALKEIGVMNLGIAYTMTNENVDHLHRLYDVARAEGVQFTCALMHSSEFYFGGKANVRERSRVDAIARAFTTLADRELATWSPKRWARAYFAHGLAVLAAEGRQLLPTRAGEDFFFLDPWGTVVPSVMHPNVLGTIGAHATFASLWKSEQAQRARDTVRKHPQPSWLICTARTAIKRHPVRLIAWVLRRKFAILTPGFLKASHGTAHT